MQDLHEGMLVGFSPDTLIGTVKECEEGKPVVINTGNGVLRTVDGAELYAYGLEECQFYLN